MKKVAAFIIILVIIAVGIYYFIPKKIESCGAMQRGELCTKWKCERGFAINGVTKPICLLGDDPVEQVYDWKF